MIGKFLYFAIILKIVATQNPSPTPNQFNGLVLEDYYTTANFTDTLNSYKILIDTTLKNNYNNVQPDIIVFPEYAFTGVLIKDFDEYATVINETDFTSNENLTLLNEYAKSMSCVVVANLLEKDGKNIYSTSIVFDGTDKKTVKLLAKYRKMHVNGNEKGLKEGNTAVTFNTTKLGVVGLISGDDILHKQPTEDLIKKNATTIVYTSSFKSEAPFKASLGIQQGYAQAYGVNLLVSTLNEPVNGYGGIGIYSQSVVANEYITGNNDSNVIVQQLDVFDKPQTCIKPTSIIPEYFNTFNVVLTKTKANIDKFNLNFNDKGLNTKILNGTQNTQLCDGKFCCTFNVTVSNTIFSKPKLYQLAVRGGNERVCAVMTCNDDKKLCGHPNQITDPQKFSKILISTKNVDRTYRPYALNNDLTTIKSYFCQQNTSVEINSSKDLGKVGVYGFVSDVATGSATSLKIGTQLIALILAIKYFF